MDLGRNWPYKGQLIPRDSKQLTLSKTLMHLTIKVMDRKAWQVAVHGVSKSWRQLSNWTDWLTHPNLVSNCYCLDPYPIPPPFCLSIPQGGGQVLETWPTVFPFCLAKKWSHSFLFHNSVSVFLFSLSAQRANILATNWNVCVCLVSQSCPIFVTQGLQPTRLLCPWNSPSKKTGSLKVVRAESIQPCLLLRSLLGCSPQAPLSMEFSRQELDCASVPSSGAFPAQGSNPHPLCLPALAGRFFTPWATWEASC